MVKHLSKFVFNPIKIDELKPVHYLGAFWYPIIIFVGFGITLSFPMWCLCIPEVEAYSDIFSQLRLPVLVASFTVPITVAVSRMHGSKQKAANLALLSRSTDFSQYYEHRKYFFEFIDTLTEDFAATCNMKIDNKSKFYSFLYPANSNKKFDLSFDEKLIRAKFEIFKDDINTEVLIHFNANNLTEEEKFQIALNRSSKYLGLSFTKSGLKVYCDLLRDGVTDNLALSKSLAAIWVHPFRLASEFSEDANCSELIDQFYRVPIEEFIFSINFKERVTRSLSHKDATQLTGHP
jgi:hypothetical protein